MNEILAMPGLGLASVWIIEKLKKSSWFPLANAGTDKLNRFLSVLTAALVACGMTASYDSQGGILTVTGVTIQNGIRLVIYVLSQTAVQEMIYRVVVKKQAPIPAD